VARYDPVDAAAVSRQVRESAGQEMLVDELVDLYEEVLAERRDVVDDPLEEQRAASLCLQALAGPVYQRDLLHWFVARLFKIPFVRTAIRLRAVRERADHPLQRLLGSLDET